MGPVLHNIPRTSPLDQPRSAGGRLDDRRKLEFFFWTERELGRGLVFLLTLLLCMTF
jgi:hypothetical protein